MASNESVCVECGKITKYKKLYRKFEGGATRLLFCESCDQVLDKYLEYDPVIICLDILLHKPQAYRHVLINRKPKIEWHLCILYLLSDAYMKWSDINYPSSSSSNKTSAMTAQDHSVLELEFYYIFLSQSCIEYLLFFCGLFLGIKVFLDRTSNQLETVVSYREVLAAILLSSFGKLLVIPVVLWAHPSSQFCLWLIKLFVFTSNAEAMKDMNFFKASMLVSFGFLASLLCPNGATGVLSITSLNDHKGFVRYFMNI